MPHWIKINKRSCLDEPDKSLTFGLQWFSSHFCIFYDFLTCTNYFFKFVIYNSLSHGGGITFITFLGYVYRKGIDSHLYWKSACFHQAWFYFTLLPLRWNKLTARKEIDWNLHIKWISCGKFARMGRANVCCIDNCRMLRNRARSIKDLNSVV